MPVTAIVGQTVCEKTHETAVKYGDKDGDREYKTSQQFNAKSTVLDNDLVSQQNSMMETKFENFCEPNFKCSEKSYAVKRRTSSIRDSSSHALSEIDSEVASSISTDSKAKKQVTFSPDTINHERESKPKRVKKKKKRKLLLDDSRVFREENLLKSSGQTGKYKSTQSIQSDESNVMITKKTNALDLNNAEQDLSDGKNIKKREKSSRNFKYIKFTKVWISPENNEEGASKRKSFRIKYFFDLLQDIHDHHVKYNSLNVNLRCQYLLENILKRYIIAFELAMTEGFLNFGATLTKNVVDTTRYLQTALHNVFFKIDGSPKDLPIFSGDADGLGLYRATRIVSVLNRISNDRPRHDMSHMPGEVCLTKLQLELLALIELPIKSVMYRSVLSVIPLTAEKAASHMQSVLSGKSRGIYWITNSKLRYDYENLLQEFGLISRVFVNYDGDGVRKITSLDRIPQVKNAHDYLSKVKGSKLSKRLRSADYMDPRKKY